MLMKQMISGAIVIFIVVVFLTGCHKDDLPFSNQNKIDFVFYGLNASNYLIKFNARKPQETLNKIAISGLQNGEKILAIDFRPATGQLYGLGSSSRLYFINLTSGQATALGTTAFSPALNGSIAGYHFSQFTPCIQVSSDCFN
jgi:hypothetical protein